MASDRNLLETVVMYLDEGAPLPPGVGQRLLTAYREATTENDRLTDKVSELRGDLEHFSQKLAEAACS